MAWKVERWQSEVFPGVERLLVEYKNLTKRELAIVSAGVLDLALAELITLRLLDIGHEAEDFLGLDEDGRAPVGSFGSRIQLALLLGLITSTDATMLRILKSIRNKAAHKVGADFTSPSMQREFEKLFAAWKRDCQESRGPVSNEKDLLLTDAHACHGLLLAVFVKMHAQFHLLTEHVTRIQPLQLPPRVLYHHAVITMAKKARDVLRQPPPEPSPSSKGGDS